MAGNIGHQRAAGLIPAVKFHTAGMKPAARRCVLLCLCSLALLGAVGCSAANKNKGDPLMGEFGPKGEGAKAPPTKTSSNQVPPIPTASYGVSTANLAAGTLPGSRNLAISDPQPAPNSGPGALTAGTKDSANAVLSVPPPAVQAVPRDSSPVVPATFDKGQPPPPDPLLTQQPAPVSPPPPGQGPADPLQGQLKAHGVTWQRAENVPGGVKFTCIVPNPQNPQVSRAYEAIGPDYPAAVRAVLWEIDNKR
jgi:hypothetical protein